MNHKFKNIARFIGSYESNDRILEILKSPPTEKLPHERTIINQKQINKLSKYYDKQKKRAFLMNSFKRMLLVK